MSPSRTRAIHPISGSGLSAGCIEGSNIRRARLIVSSTTRCNSKCCFRNDEIRRELEARMVLCQVEFVKNFTSFRLVPQELRSIYDKVRCAKRINEEEAA